MITEILLLAAFVSIITAAFCAAAGKVYEFQKASKDDENPIYKIIGQDQKHIDNRAQWIKRYRTRVIVYYVVIIVVAAIVLNFFKP